MSDEESQSTSVTVADVQQMMKKKDTIEAQIKAYYDILKGQNSAGMDEPLVDIEGYPRTDIDVYEVRTARHNIICLQNDHKALMKQIEKALHQLHARDREKHRLDEAEAHQETMEQENSVLSAFAKIDTVSPGSPASISKPLSITIIRNGQNIHIGLTPQRWSGRGLLGCNIVPL
ncbi:26S proteasome non-ATPase regulatory subunit 9 isoform X2 [Heptranchias perlo]|uniref:26S proteasome non-ATPase regulatory subunit 9 isoform X2 n=1 Tax=Heptranchias perlo TaxID=212740 RepID=UPI00355A3E3C